MPTGSLSAHKLRHIRALGSLSRVTESCRRQPVSHSESSNPRLPNTVHSLAKLQINIPCQLLHKDSTRYNKDEICAEVTDHHMIGQPPRTLRHIILLCQYLLSSTDLNSVGECPTRIPTVSRPTIRGSFI